jgi:2,5-diketo-D-gluconate reductase A
MEPGSTIELRTGRRMPIIGLGTWQLTDDTAGTVEEAFRLGYFMIDTSGDYGTQPGIAEGIRHSGVGRDAIYLVTKVEEYEDAYDSLRRSLDELDVERADLVLIHRPPDRGPGTGLWRGLTKARDEGLTTDIGVSNYTLRQIDDLTGDTGETPVVNQIEWSPFGWSREMLEGCRDRGIVIQAWSPLTRANRLDDNALIALADRHHRTPAQIVLRWNLQLGVVPLPKANRREHLVENLGVFDFELNDEEMRAIGRFDENWSALGSSPVHL